VPAPRQRFVTDPEPARLRAISQLLEVVDDPRSGSGMPSKSRNGWKAVQISPSSRSSRPTSPAVPPSNVSRSFSKISTPAKPASAIARSLVSSRPLIETVAMDVNKGGSPDVVCRT
jgi:hypothetical protein